MASRSLVTIAYEQLSDPDADLSSAIAAAYGPEGLGILVVDGVPGFVAKREALLPLASRVAALPAEALEALSDPASHWNFGWSHGRERLEGDRPGAWCCAQRTRFRSVPSLLLRSRGPRLPWRAAQTRRRARSTPTRCWTCRPRTRR